MAKDVESLAGLQQLFQELQIPDCFVEALQASSIASVADFAYAYPSTADLSVFAQARSEDFWQALQVADPEHSMPMARMRRALTRAQALAKVHDELPAYAQQALPVPFPAEGQQSVHANVWAEHAPPRLDASTVAQLQASFRSNYPGEHLDADSTPSIRLLSLVHMWCKPGGAIKWIPWQMRLSSKQYQDIIEARTSRTLRTEAQLISTALFDETPELPVEHVRLNASWLASKQAVFRNAIALCNGAHLAVLKAFDKKVLDLCAQAMPASSGLRTANTQELLQADRTLWNEMAKLVSEGWTLDEALHEFTSIRADVHALLQPRALPAQPAGQRPNKGRGKGNGGKSPQRVLKLDKTGAPPPPDPHANLLTRHGNKTLCLRFNKGRCTDKRCKFAHLCAARLPNGQACGQHHPATQHKHKPSDKAPADPPPAGQPHLKGPRGGWRSHLAGCFSSATS